MYNETLTQDKKNELLILHLNDIVIYLNKSKLILKDDLYGNIRNLNIYDFIELFEIIKTEIFFPNSENEDLLLVIDTLIDVLDEYIIWINSKTNNNLIYYTKIKKNIYKYYLDKTLGNSLEYNEIILKLKTSTTILYNQIFDESLKIYLNENDEPIWVNYIDTLNVISWVVNEKLNIDTISNNHINKEISQYYESFIEKIKNNNLIINDQINFLYSDILYDIDKIKYYNKYYINNHISKKYIDYFYNKEFVNNQKTMFYDKAFINAISLPLSHC